ncbi:MAG: DNA repair protein RecO C-terminal domain-containing protein [Synergistaceae bacterium]|nr:DNA repair protein RecO C-terminal domain-containing protein [Synergistaceae bacterium]
MASQGLLDASGAVLARSKMGEGGLRLTLFLKGQGILRASAPGAEAGRVRFGGGTEPFAWGTFHLRRGRGGGLSLSGVDVADDLLGLRRRPEAIRTAVRWSRLLTRFLPPEQPADELLANLYWNMRLLSNPAILPAAAEWRFLYRWLADWGIAPDMAHCSRCRRVPSPAQRMAWTDEPLICSDCDPAAQNERPSFSRGELALLFQAAERNVEGVARLFSENEKLKEKGRGVFTLASRCAEGVLFSEK